MNTHKLSNLQANRFKNLSIADGVPLGNLNVFIGPNCSGKSNFISILKFLKDCLVAGSEDEQGGKYEKAVTRIGGANFLDRYESYPSNVDFSFHFSSSKSTPKGLNYYIKLFAGGKGSKVTISEEFLADSIYSQDIPFFYYKYHDREVGKGVISIFDDPSSRKSHFEPVGDIPTTSLGLSMTHKFLEESEHPPERTPIYKIARELVENVANWHFYNSNEMDLKIIRNSEPKIGPSDIFLSKSGHNLALVIENLFQQYLDFEESINKSMCSILPRTRKFRPARTGLMSINLQWYLKEIENDYFYLNEMSDGAVRMLCWATVLLSPKVPSLLVIDEPELGLHVSWMPILAEWIKIASQKTQVIICTHSPDLLDFFTDEIESIKVFSSRKGRHFSVNSLSMTHDLREKLDEGWKVGDLYRDGDPIIGGWPW